MAGATKAARAPSTSQGPDKRKPQLSSQWQAAATQQQLDLVDTDCRFKQMVQLMQLLDLLQRECGAVLGSLSLHGGVSDRVVCGGSFELSCRRPSRLLELGVDESHRQGAGSVLRVK